MKKFVAAIVAGAALCAPSAALAGHGFDYETYNMANDSSQEECEEALAMQRRMMTEGVRGKERGQFNRTFNRAYQCEDMDGDGDYDIENYG